MVASSETEGQSRRNASDHLRIKHLRMLDLIDVRGSLSGASHDLHLSQPAVTKLLHDIEAVFGSSLVERGPRGGRLTTAGRAVMAHLRAALAHIDLAVRQRGEPLPVVRLGVLPVAAMRVLGPAFARLRADGVVFRLDLQESTVQNLLTEVATGRRDCAIGRMDPSYVAESGAELVVTPLLEEGLAIAASRRHPLARAGRRLALDRLAQASWVLAPAGFNTRQHFDQLFLDVGMTPPKPVIESPSFHTNLHLAAKCDLLTFAPEFAVSAYAKYGLVRQLRTASPPPASQLAFIATEPALRIPAVVQLRDALVAVASTDSSASARAVQK